MLSVAVCGCVLFSTFAICCCYLLMFGIVRYTIFVIALLFIIACGFLLFSYAIVCGSLSLSVVALAYYGDAVGFVAQEHVKGCDN